MVDYDERDCNLHRISNSNTRAVSTFSLIYIVNDKNKQRRTSISKSYNIKLYKVHGAHPVVAEEAHALGLDQALPVQPLRERENG